jgi:hypothetical protein
VGRVGLRTYLNIEAGCEGTLACSCEEDGPDGGVVGELLEDGGEVEPHAGESQWRSCGLMRLGKFTR